MLKLAGGLCVIAGAGWLGLCAIRVLRARTRTLQQLIDALTYMEEELAFRLTPLPVILDRLGRSERESVGYFFADCRGRLGRHPQDGLQAAWQEAAAAQLSILRAEERETLEPLGSVLGQYDSEGQRAALRQARERLEGYRQRAAEEQGRLGKVYAVVCLAAGAVLVLVLM